MRELFRSVMFMAVVLAIPIIPFLLFGEWLESVLESWMQEERAEPITFFAVVFLLATDIFLPVPSSTLSTLAGWRLHAFWGSLASWLGMNLGAIAGFCFAKRFGRRAALWFTKESELERMQNLSQRYGPFTLILTRGVPVFAEATVLMMGAHQLSWRRFLPPVLLSNLGVSIAYAAFGEFAARNGWFPLALGVSIALPVVLAVIVARWLPKDVETASDSEATSDSETAP